MSSRLAGAPSLVISCEHASDRVPAAFRDVLPASYIRRSGHRAVDFGAAAAAGRLARALGAPLVLGRVTRLLVDLNRSAHHPRLFSERTRLLSPTTRARILARHWRPYRDRVQALVAERIAARSRVLHLSVHSFTPRLDGRTRPTDASLLYDPARGPERAFARMWLDDLRHALPELRLHANRPYRGSADGFTTHLRRSHSSLSYLGLELELNQRYRGSETWEAVVAAVIATLRARLDPDRAPGSAPA